MKLWKKTAMFCLGGGSYVVLELLWRGRSHYSMFLAGGSCFLLLGNLRRRRGGYPVITGAGLVTLVELITGLLVNRDHRVWDYRQLPMNLLGQVCLPFSLLWIPVSAGAMVLYDVAARRFDS